MRIPNQVCVYCAFKERGRYFYLLAKRNGKRGGFWQAITGGEENFDSGDLFRTVIREIKEEISVKISRKQIKRLPYFFKFIDREGVEKTEYCFGVILSKKQKEKICLSWEHTAVIYTADAEYLSSLLKFKQNRLGFIKFKQWVGKKSKK